MGEAVCGQSQLPEPSLPAMPAEAPGHVREAVLGPQGQPSFQLNNVKGPHSTLHGAEES